MCLAIPAKVEKLADANLAEVSVMGAERTISVDLTPDVKVGDYVLVHAGFSIEIVDETEAQKTLELIKEMPEFAEIY